MSFQYKDGAVIVRKKLKFSNRENSFKTYVLGNFFYLFVILLPKMMCHICFDSFKTLKKDLETKKLQNYNFQWVLNYLVKT